MAETNDAKNQTGAQAILEKLEKLDKKIGGVETKVGDSALAGGYDSVIRKLEEENEGLKKETSYLSVQLESVCTALMKSMKKLSAKVDELAEKKLDFDLDELASRVAEKIIIPDEDEAEEGGNAADGIDYDELACAIAKRLYVPAPATDIDYDKLAEKLSEKLPAAFAEPAQPAELDYDELACKLASAMPVQDSASADLIASKVASQLAIPGATVDVNAEALADAVAEKVCVDENKIADAIVDKVVVDVDGIAEAVAERISVTATIDDDKLAAAIAEKIPAPVATAVDSEALAKAVAEELAGKIDNDEIADCVAKKVGSVSPEEFDVMVDEDGCDTIVKQLEEKLDYEAVATAIAERLTSQLAGIAGSAEVDTDDIAYKVAERLAENAEANNEVIADRAAEILSNYMPEVDSAEIADKVIAGVVPAIPAAPVVDSAEIADMVAEKVASAQPATDNAELADMVAEKVASIGESDDYEIVIDEEGLAKLSECMTEQVNKEFELRRENEKATLSEEDKAEIEAKIEEVKTSVDELAEKISELAQRPAEYLAVAEATASDTADSEEELVTVSDVIGEEVEESEYVEETAEEQTEADEEPAEEPAPEEVAEAPAEEAYEESAYEEPAEPVENAENAEEPAEGEAENAEGGVDFLNMMKYDRSFIARIIQGSDDQKNYYGKVKTALLSYKKVNSNIGWGSERFNKGRETIARFKIRGKTLCLYLALDPKEYAYSVYHQADVSDNKSVSGTPMMVKIKSPLGAKKAIRLIDDMLEKRGGVKRVVAERDYAAMYPYETIEELIDDGLVKDVQHKK